jgi:hypothetical protein
MLKLNNLKEAHAYFKKLTGTQVGKHIGNEKKALWWFNCCLSLKDINDFIQENPVNNEYFPIVIFQKKTDFYDYFNAFE